MSVKKNIVWRALGRRKSSVARVKILNGKVYNTKTGEGIPDVNLYIPSQKLGVATLEDGSFSLNYFPGMMGIPKKTLTTCTAAHFWAFSKVITSWGEE